MRPLFRYRLINASVLALMVALGLGSKTYQGWGAVWGRDYGGDIIYEVFWIWLIGFFWPKQRVRGIAIAVFVITSLIECSQLIPFPASWKANVLWRLLLGTHFAWWDFPHYALGSLLGGVSLSALLAQFDLGSRKPAK
ncbi:MAG: DUF2809 domain-containing protein [Cyanobacteria bacterium P01_D01_bin.44]